MFIWVGINVDNQLYKIKEKTQLVEKELSFRNSNFTLPLHISLKISFEINEDIFQDIINDITKIYEDIKPFEIETNGICYENNICWILMKENLTLIGLSKKINDLMLTKYSIPLHEYDLDYKFHTTLFMDNDIEKVKKAYTKVQNIEIPKVIKANKFIIGLSDSGALGSYKVYEEICKI